VASRPAIQLVGSSIDRSGRARLGARKSKGVGRCTCGRKEGRKEGEEGQGWDVSARGRGVWLAGHGPARTRNLAFTRARVTRCATPVRSCLHRTGGPAPDDLELSAAGSVDPRARPLGHCMLPRYRTGQAVRVVAPPRRASSHSRRPKHGPEDDQPQRGSDRAMCVGVGSGAAGCRLERERRCRDSPAATRTQGSTGVPGMGRTRKHPTRRRGMFDVAPQRPARSLEPGFEASGILP
jgi:hypothetical protein